MITPTLLRALIGKYGNIGYVVVGLYLFATWLRRRTLPVVRRILWIGAGVLLWYWCLCARHVPASRLSATAQYSIVDLGTLPGSSSSGAYGINEAGQVVGGCHTNYDNWRAFVWDKGTMQELPNLGRSNWAIRINVKNISVGLSNKRAVLWQNGKIQALDKVGGTSIARGINARGQIAGSALERRMAFLWENGKVTDLGHLPNLPDAYATGINAKGQVVGASGMHEYQAFHAFLWQKGEMLDLGTLVDKQWSEATAINDNSVVVGEAFVARNTWHGCFWKNNKIHDMGTLPFDTHSSATALNNKDVIIGYVGQSGVSAKRHAFVFTKGKMTDLNTLIPSDAGWVLERADDVNDKGQIVGTGMHEGQRRAFLLTPVNR